MKVKKIKQSTALCMVLFVVFSAIGFADSVDAAIYYNNAYGFSYNYSGYHLDASNEAIKTHFYHNDTEIDIFYDDFEGTVHNTTRFVNYSNSMIKNSEYVDVFLNETRNVQGYKATIKSWYRKPLKHVPNAFPFYMAIDIIKNNSEVYTIYAKSKHELNIDDLLYRIQFYTKDSAAPLQSKQYKRMVNPTWSRKTTDFYFDEFAKTDYVDFGLFEPMSKQSLLRLSEMEAATGHRFNYLLEYYDMSLNIPHNHLQDLYDNNRILEFTYQTSYHLEYNPNLIYDILDGKKDAEIQALADALKSIDGPVFFRLDNEMNGDWCSYNAIHYQRDTELFIELWRHVHDVIVNKGADNVIFVWNPNEKSFPEFTWNHCINYFPGERYVDVIGVTGYNTGNYYKGETWRTFSEIYRPIMDDYKKRFLGYDFYITEFGSSTYGGNRDAWLKDMLNVINDFDLKLAIYWSGTDYDGNNIPARLYRIDTDPDALKIIGGYLDEHRSTVKNQQTESKNIGVSEIQPQKIADEEKKR